MPLETVEEHAEGLVCLSGCARQGVRDEPTMRRLLAAFGPDRLRVELQRPFQRHDRTLNRGLSSLAARLGIACVATGNVHAHARSRAPLQDAFVALRHHTTLDASEPVRRGNFAHVLASPAAMAARFEDHPEAVAETLELADRLRFDLDSDLGYRYPGSEDAGAGRALAELCWSKMDERYPAGHPCHADAHARLEEELRVIEALGLPGFFILHRDLLELAREVAVEVRGPDTARALLPPGRGRGSSVSSIVCYLTGLSHIDPVENQLFLGRFLNEELTSLPDIDLDFPRDIREVLIPRIHERYGAERSALVAAFPTFRSRGAIRELGKVLGLPPGELERAARGAEPWAVRGVTGDVESALGLEPGGPPAAVYDPDPRMAAPFAMSTAEWQAMVNGRDPAKEGDREATAEARYAALPGRWEWLARLCDEAYGLPRHLSQHSGGMIVSTRPLVDCCPVLPAAMEGRQLCQWDKDSCADAGFLKIDLLGLGMLSAVERCVESIARTRGERVDLSRIPFDDADTYTAIQEADTMGVFQIESRAQMQSLRRTRPRDARRPHDPGRDRAPGADPRRRGQPLHRAPAGPARGPGLRRALRPSVAGARAARHARHDHLPGPGDRVRDGVRGLLAGRGRGAAPRDEPQALRGGDRGLPPALRRGRRPHPRRRRGDRGARVLDDRRLLGLRLPQGPRRRVRAARLPVDLAARALRAGVPVRAAQRAADGLLRLRHARPRGAAARDPDAAGRRQRERGGVRGGSRRLGADRARLRGRRALRRGRGARGRARGGRALPLAGRPRLARGSGEAVAGEARVGGRVRRAGGDRRLRSGREPRAALRAVAARGGRARAIPCARAPSSRSRSTPRPRPSCASWRPGSRWWPTTPRPG